MLQARRSGEGSRMTLSISVVTPSLNQARFLNETILSVLGQDYPRLEYVVVDGGSTDGSVEIIERHRPRLHYFVSEPDSGHARALNKGFAHTSGEIMAWLNSDDMYLPWTFRTVSEIFESFPDVNWIVGLNTWWNENGAMIATGYIYNNIFDYLSGKFFGIQQESVFWRRSLWERAGGSVDENYKFMVDAELWTRFFVLDNLWHAGCVLSGYRMHRENRANRFQDQCREEITRAINAMREKCGPSKLRGFEQDYLVISYDVQRVAWGKTSVARMPNRP
jgi:glycosyltransferase involved in cell wall biosynthesis